jgi:NifU-like protein involved in Fe-S cluster formation
MKYDALTMQYFENRQNAGEFASHEEDITAAMLGSSDKGDVVQLQIKINSDGVIEKALFKAQASVVTTALCAWLAEQLPGKTLVEARQITAAQIAAVFNLPLIKMHCALLVENVLQTVISEHQNKIGDSKCTVRS